MSRRRNSGAVRERGAGSSRSRAASGPGRSRVRAVWGGLAAAIVLAGIGQTAGCTATPEQRYRMLRFFFDGVPPPPGAEFALIPEEPGLGEELKMARARPITPRFTLHEPYAEKQCDECHSGRRSNQLRVPAEELCRHCHDPEDFPGEVVHGPVAAGACIQCHSPHRSTHDFLLLETESDLCSSCHDTNTFARLESHRANEGADCTRCHDPHAADREYLLREDESGS